MPSPTDDGDHKATADRIIREFILAAPPGELQTVLAALRVLTGDDALFFSIAPRHCLAHHMRHLSVFSLCAAERRLHHESPAHHVDSHTSAPPEASQCAADGTDADGEDSGGTVSFLTGRHNHLVTFIRRYAKAHGIAPREVLESVEKYFCEHCVTLVTASHNRSPRDTSIDDEKKRINNSENKLGEDPFTDLIPDDGVVALDCVFFDPALKLYIEIDPMSERCLRTVRFASGAAMPPALAAVEHQRVSDNNNNNNSCGGGGGGGPLLCARTIAEHLLAHYAATCLAPVSHTSVTFSSLPSSSSLLSSSSSFSSSLLPSASRVGSSAVLRPAGTRHTLTLAVSADLRAPRGMWAGRWASLFVIAADKSEGTEGAEGAEGAEGVFLRGETHVHAHYYEDGNAHLETRRVVGPVALPEWPVEMFDTSGDLSSYSSSSSSSSSAAVDVPRLCDVLMRAIYAHEQAVHDAVLRAAKDSGDRALQRLRRRLPITRQLFDFTRGRAVIPCPLATRADSGGVEE